MKPVFQHKFGHGGSCFTACIASIVECDLKDIPNFIDYGPDYILELWKFLKPLGMSYTCVTWKMHEAPERIPADYHVISGYGPRGFRHSVVGFKGKQIHDPFPGGGGLITVDSWGVIHKDSFDNWELFTEPFDDKDKGISVSHSQPGRANE